VVGERVRARLRDIDQQAKRKLDRARFVAQQRLENRDSITTRAKRDLRGGRDDIEPGTERGDELQQQQSAISRLVSAVEPAVSGANRERQPRRRGRDDAVERAGAAARPSAPMDQTTDPLAPQGTATMQDFVTGRRPAEGVARFEQTTNRQDLLQWQAQQRDGAVTVVTARSEGGEWVITASEEAPNGRLNGSTVISRGIDSRREARERALDFLERNPDGIPMDALAGQAGAAGFVTGETPIDDGLVFGDGQGGDEGSGSGGGGLIAGDDLRFVFGGGDDE
jgi:hypothetical protein